MRTEVGLRHVRWVDAAAQTVHRDCTLSLKGNVTLSKWIQRENSSDGCTCQVDTQRKTILIVKSSVSILLLLLCLLFPVALSCSSSLSSSCSFFHLPFSSSSFFFFAGQVVRAFFLGFFFVFFLRVCVSVGGPGSVIPVVYKIDIPVPAQPDVLCKVYVWTGSSIVYILLTGRDNS